MIEIKNLFFSYTKNPPYLLENINFTINKGDYISLVGENGSGKSTLVKLILRILSPTSGSITYQNIRIGYVPQRFDNLNTQFPITVFEMLNCYRKTLKIKEKDTIDKYLEMVKMNDFQNTLIGNLSGGQCQKVFIARALMGNPELLILDEPSTGVDIGSQNEIYGLIKDLNRNNGITVISIEHNIKAAVTNSTLIYHLSNNRGHLCHPSEYVNEYMKSNIGGNQDASI